MLWCRRRFRREDVREGVDNDEEPEEIGRSQGGRDEEVRGGEAAPAGDMAKCCALSAGELCASGHFAVPLSHSADVRCSDRGLLAGRLVSGCVAQRCQHDKQHGVWMHVIIINKNKVYNLRTTTASPTDTVQDLLHVESEFHKICGYVVFYVDWSWFLEAMFPVVH